MTTQTLRVEYLSHFSSQNDADAYEAELLSIAPEFVPTHIAHYVEAVREGGEVEEGAEELYLQWMLSQLEESDVAQDCEGDEAETEELRVALGAGGTGKGTAGALRGSAGALKDLEKRQKSRQTRASRDALDRALIDLATYFRDALMVASGAGAVAPSHPDMTERVAALAAHAPRDRLLRCIEAVLACREALAANVKPKFAIDAMVATVGQALRSG